MSVKGVDVSSYQSESYPISGCDFVVVKATQGTSYVNSHHAAQAKRGYDHGLVVGHYHYAEGSNISGQVNYFLQQVKPRSGDFLALDWENPAMSSAEKDQFLSEVDSKSPLRVLLYGNLDYWLHRDQSGHRADGLWIADPSAPAGHPRIQSPWLIHQYTDSPIDTNFGNWVNRSAMGAWANRSMTPNPNTLPTVSLVHAIAAFHTDPKAKQGHTTFPADVKLIEHALVKVGVMHSSKYTEDGSAGTLSVQGYSNFQREYSRKHNLGWKGADVNGIPGLISLRALATESKLFTVVK